MNTWAIVGIFVGILVIASVALVTANAGEDADVPVSSQSCSTCGNSCTAESNCGLAKCGAVSGGTCGCGK